MSISITIENNRFKNNSKGINNINISTPQSNQEDLSLEIRENDLSDNSILIDNISSQILPDTEEILKELFSELNQLKNEYIQNKIEIDEILNGLNTQMSHNDIITWIRKGANLFMQSTISGILGNSAYELLKNILFPTN